MAQRIWGFHAQEALRRITADVDSDEKEGDDEVEEDFEELDIISDTNENNEDEEDNDKEPGPSNTNYESCDANSWTHSCPRARRRNIIRQRGGSRQFIQARVDSVLDILTLVFP